MMHTDAVFQKLQTARPAQRRAILQKEIGTPTDSPWELHLRAKLLTRLRREKLWPLYGAELSAFQEEDDGA